MAAKSKYISDLLASQILYVPLLKLVTASGFVSLDHVILIFISQQNLAEILRNLNFGVIDVIPKRAIDKCNWLWSFLVEVAVITEDAEHMNLLLVIHETRYLALDGSLLFAFLRHV